MISKQTKYHLSTQNSKTYQKAVLTTYDNHFKRRNYRKTNEILRFTLFAPPVKLIMNYTVYFNKRAYKTYFLIVIIQKYIN